MTPERKAGSGRLRTEYQRVTFLSPITLSSVSTVVYSNDDIQMKNYRQK